MIIVHEFKLPLRIINGSSIDLPQTKRKPKEIS